MIWVKTILPIILGLVVAGPFQNAEADSKFFHLKAKNSTKYSRPGNKTHRYIATTTVRPSIVDNALYMKYACQGKQNGLRLPIEGSCTQYLECQQGKAKLMTCMREKHFSTFGLTCIDVKLSNCSVKCECCNKEDGLYPDLTNCSNFIVCSGGKAHRQSCGSYFKFNSEQLSCDIPQRARCSDMSNNNTYIERKIETESSKTPLYLVSHKVCLNRSNGYTVGVAGSCNKFYLCANGKGYLKSCGHMQFNSATHYCDSRTRIYCPQNEDNFVIVDSDEIPRPWLRPEIPAVPEVPQPPHRVPGQPFPQEELPSHPPVVGKPEQGPDGVPKPPVVDPVPVPPVVVLPDVEEIIDPKEYAGLCDEQSVGALLALPKHCNKYIRCKWDWFSRRVAEVESCPKGKHFNAKSKICDVPRKAGCVNHSIKKHF
ncbi:uncharacterized protein LOC129941222 [Eupeodes corollae]|uniref:uncharacterized protein LOC129941222 n=1 Tax=Eupeodes corollae TaxID=290404 RepID=UPI0024903AF7|nr:uncharacterized protein LOC129941222 [Eupeodes corollae]